MKWLFHIKNRYYATALVVACAALLGLSKEANSIWAVFGASNQLVAALTLLILSAWIINLVVIIIML